MAPNLVKLFKEGTRPFYDLSCVFSKESCTVIERQQQQVIQSATKRIPYHLEQRMSEQLLPKSLTALLGFMLVLVAGCRDEIEIAVNTGDPVPLATQAGAPLFEGMVRF